jgi:hypothetical protein
MVQGCPFEFPGLFNEMALHVDPALIEKIEDKAESLGKMMDSEQAALVNELLDLMESKTAAVQERTAARLCGCSKCRAKLVV